MVADGVIEFACHSHGHLDFSAHAGQTPETALEDLKQSREILEGLAGTRAGTRHIAWPWGKSGPVARQVASDLGFAMQFTVASRPVLDTGTHDTVWPRLCVENLSPVSFSLLLHALAVRPAAVAMSALNQWKRRDTR